MSAYMFISILAVSFWALCCRGFVSGQTLRERYFTRTTVCAGQKLQPHCLDPSYVIIFQGVLHGTKLLNSCEASECCTADATDCIFHDYDSILFNSCSGRNLCNPITTFAVDAHRCGSSYPVLTNYVTVEYYCVLSLNIGSPNSGNISTGGKILYLRNKDYPSPIRTGETSRYCSVETQSCGSKINVYFINLDLSCRDRQQTIVIQDKATNWTYSCANNTGYIITLGFTSSSNYLVVEFKNPNGIRDGHYWLGFERRNAPWLSLHCPMTPQTYCIGWQTVATTVMSKSYNFTKEMVQSSIATSRAPSAFTEDVTSSSHTSNSTSSGLQLLSNAIHITCGSNMWNISVDMSLVRQIYPSIKGHDIYLGEEECTGIQDANMLLFQQPLQNCSTTHMKTNISINFSNQLIYAEHDPNYFFIVRRHIWELTVECDVSRTAAFHTQLHHGTLHLQNANITPAPGQSALFLKFYKDSSYHVMLPGPPLNVSLGDNIFVKAFTMTLDDDVKMVLQSCYVTPPADTADTAMRYSLIKNGCVTDPNTHIISYSLHEVRFVYQEIEFSSYSDGIEIYCQAIICDVTDFSPRCSPACGTQQLIG